MERPLADEIRPQSLDEVVGQRHLLGPNGVLRRIIESGVSANMVFYGPSGTGKTTIGQHDRPPGPTGHCIKLNATTASLQDIKDIIVDVGTPYGPRRGVLLYLDEIQYFNKKQQQALLEFMENGKITLIASTTENPYFYVYTALRRRSTVFEFKAVSPKEVLPAVQRALKIEQERLELPLKWEEEVPWTSPPPAAGMCARPSMRWSCCAAPRCPTGGETYSDQGRCFTAGRSAAPCATTGTATPTTTSSRPCRSPSGAATRTRRSTTWPGLLEAGDLLSPCRRLLVIAAEDIGLAYPQAIAIIKACVDAAVQLGLPEARLPSGGGGHPLGYRAQVQHCSQCHYRRHGRRGQGKTGDIPRCLQNVHADTTGFDNKQHYKYPHDYPNRWVEQQYLPDALQGVRYYQWGENKTEQAARAYWEKIKGGPL